jgi:GTP cyclohydrolase I
MMPMAPIIDPNLREKNISGLTEELLVQIGEDPQRPGLLRTPERVAKAWQELTAGYRVDVDKLINGALFDEACSEMVVVRDIQFFSLCEHHLLPFFGVCHVAYLPQGKILGLSKIPKLVKAFARRLQVQERLTNEIAETLMAKVNPLGVGVVMEARHMCMEMRGAESLSSPTATSAMVGAFRSDARTRDEFLSLIFRRR